jgi:hypothetical protein
MKRASPSTQRLRRTDAQATERSAMSAGRRTASPFPTAHPDAGASAPPANPPLDVAAPRSSASLAAAAASAGRPSVVAGSSANPVPPATYASSPPRVPTVRELALRPHKKRASAQPTARPPCAPTRADRLVSTPALAEGALVRLQDMERSSSWRSTRCTRTACTWPATRGWRCRRPGARRGRTSTGQARNLLCRGPTPAFAGSGFGVGPRPDFSAITVAPDGTVWLAEQNRLAGYYDSSVP